MDKSQNIPDPIPDRCEYCQYFSQGKIGKMLPFAWWGNCSFYQLCVHFDSECEATLRKKKETENKLRDIHPVEEEFVDRYINLSGYEETVSNKKWNWAAFFLNSIWAISKKLYSIGIPLLISQILFIYLFFKFLPEKKLDWYDNISNKTEISFYNFSFIFIQVFIFLPIQLYLGTMGNKLVEKNLKWHGFKKVEKQDEKTSDIE